MQSAGLAQVEDVAKNMKQVMKNPWPLVLANFLDSVTSRDALLLSLCFDESNMNNRFLYASWQDLGTDSWSAWKTLPCTDVWDFMVNERILVTKGALHVKPFVSN